MGDPPPDPGQPPPGSSQGSEPRRSGEAPSVQFSVPPGVPPAELAAPRGSQEGPAGQGWARGAGRGPDEEPRGSAEYPLSAAERQAYLDEDGLQAELLEQLQQGRGSLLQQLEAAFQDPQPDAAGQFAYQREDQPFGEEAPHGPYASRDPSLQFSPSELGFLPFDMEVSEPEPRELAVQNAKAYLLQTSISCDLSL